MAKKEQILYSVRFGLKKARNKKGYTQEKLAQILDVNLKTVQNWEQGISNPSTEKLIQVADLLDCDLDYLIGKIKETTHDNAFIRQETGLSEEAIIRLKGMTEEFINISVYNNQLDILEENEIMDIDSNAKDFIAGIHSMLLSDMICSDYFFDLMDQMLETFDNDQTKAEKDIREFKLNRTLFKLRDDIDETKYKEFNRLRSNYIERLSKEETLIDIDMIDKMIIGLQERKEQLLAKEKDLQTNTGKESVNNGETD